MYRELIVKCILINFISGVCSNGEHTNHFSYDYIKNFLKSVFFEERTSAPEVITVDPNYEYEFYKVPGYDHILIKTKPRLVNKVTNDKPDQEIYVHPFESFLGTQNKKETLQTFHNVDNLFSTKIINKQQTNILRKVMTPMIIDTIKSETGDQVKPDLNMSETSTMLKNVVNYVPENDNYQRTDELISFPTYDSGDFLKESEMTPNKEKPMCGQTQETSFDTLPNENTQFVNNQPGNDINKSDADGDLNAANFNHNSSNKEVTQKKVIKHLFDLNSDNDYSIESSLNMKNNEPTAVVENNQTSIHFIPLPYIDEAKNRTNGTLETTKIAAEIVYTTESSSKVDMFTENKTYGTRVTVGEQLIHVNSTEIVGQNYTNNKNLASGNSVNTKETWDDVPLSITETAFKGRGDIPEE